MRGDISRSPLRGSANCGAGGYVVEDTLNKLGLPILNDGS